MSEALGEEAVPIMGQMPHDVVQGTGFKALPELQERAFHRPLHYTGGKNER